MKLKSFFAVVSVALTSLLVAPVVNAQVVVAPAASQTLTVKGSFVSAPVGASAAVTVSCRNLVNSPSQVSIATFTGSGDAVIPFAFSGVTASNPTGTNCRIDVTTTPWNASVQLSVAEIDHVGVGGVDSASWKYPSGWFPVYSSTTATLRVVYPSVTVKSQVSNWDYIAASYRVDAFNGSVPAGSVIVKGVDNSSRTFTSADFPLAGPNATFNVTVIETGGATVPVVSVAGIASGGSANLVFVGTPRPTVPATTTPTLPPSTTTTTVAPTTTTTTVAPVAPKVVTKCYRKVGKKFISVKCPK